MPLETESTPAIVRSVAYEYPVFHKLNLIFMLEMPNFVVLP
jgi:hypothetical protein